MNSRKAQAARVHSYITYALSRKYDGFVKSPKQEKMLRIVIWHIYFGDLTNALYVLSKKATFRGVGGVRQLLSVSTKNK